MNKSGAFGVLQRVGRSFMLPIALLPVAGLLLGVGASFSNPTTIAAYHLTAVLGKGTIGYVLFSLMDNTGNIIFSNLALLFAMGVALGMAEKEKGTAALAGAIAFLVMNQTVSTMLQLAGTIDSTGKILSKTVHDGAIAPVLGITTLQMGVFGGIIVGLGVAALHNRFYKIKLPDVLSFFGGVRFVPIISTVVYIGVGVVMFFIWPIIQNGIYALGWAVLGSGYIGTWIYGIIERALIPFGLHHIFYLPFWQTGVGGSMLINGKLVQGAQNIFFAELGDPHWTQHFSVSATRFMSGKFPLMMFGLPGAALAMYTTAKSSKKKIVGGLLLSAALTSFLTGITEPIEFTFLFVAPVLYGIHCVLAGASYMIMHICGVGIGMTFSGGVIDFLLFGVIQGTTKTSWPWVLVVGVAYFIGYYFLFRFLILKWDLKTPGREDDDAETKLFTRKDVDAKKATEFSETSVPAIDDVDHSAAAQIVEGLGGADNIKNMDSCATRLRVTVADGSKVVDRALRHSGAAGIIQSGSGVQIIYGPKVTVIKSDIEDYLDKIGKPLNS